MGHYWENGLLAWQEPFKKTKVELDLLTDN